MPSTETVSSDFKGFIAGLGLRPEVTAALWQADIRTPQELGSVEVTELRKISNNSLLINKIYPILQKHVFNITMAKDPYKKAMMIIRKHAGEDAGEPMDTSNADSTSSDATCFVPGQSGHAVEHPTVNTTRVEVGQRYSNNATRINTSANRTTKANISFGNSGRQDAGKQGPGSSIVITGGNFVQANVLGSGPVTYNNRNTVISTSMDQDVGEVAKKRRAQLLNETVFFGGSSRRMVDLAWNDNRDFWLDRIHIPRADIGLYDQHMLNEDAYEIRGTNRALILNNSHFHANTRMGQRTGADMDCVHMKEAFDNMGFRVQVETDKTAVEMRTLLNDFAASRDNATAGAVAIYIGSHGERDERGDDTFVGVDGNRVKFNEVRDMFGPKNCKLLRKKPKLFFLQFCRQDVRADHPPAASLPMPVSSDAGAFTDEKKVTMQEDEILASEEEHVMDVLCVYATLAGSKAYRDTADGSWFVTAMIAVFANHADKDDLLSMLTKVNNSISFNEGTENRRKAVQISEVVHNLRKKVFFFPGLND